MPNKELFLFLATINIATFIHASYTPNENVVAAHNMPHLTTNLQKTSNQFLAGVVGANNTLSGGDALLYLESTVVFPAILGSLGVLSVIIFQIVMCCRWCCKRCCFKTFQCCCKCVKRPPEGSELVEGGIVASPNTGLADVYIAKISIMAIAFAVFLLFVVIADLTALAGLKSIQASFKDFGNALHLLGNIFQHIHDGSSDMQIAGKSITSTLASQTCHNVSSTFLKSFSSGVGDFGTAAGDIASLTSGLPKFFEGIKTTLETTGKQNFDQVFFIYLAVILFDVLLFVGAAFSRSKVFFSVPFLLSELIVLTLTIISAFEMVLVVRLTDTLKISFYFHHLPPPFFV